ncbi:hypothetical protein [Neobacillus niacini]|nr:hypothetical protein [Neobacillus niacini]
MHLKNTIISMKLQKKWHFFVMGVMICLDLMGMGYHQQNANLQR